MQYFIGKTYDESLQNYAVTADPVTLVSSIADLSLKGNTAGIKIKKIDVDTNEPIPSTVFELSKQDGTVIGTATTNAEGVVTFNDLYQDTYVLKEIKSNDDYIVMQETINIPAYYNKITDKTITNKHKEGNVKVLKVDKDNNKIVLGNVEFDLYSNEFGRVIGTYRTDVNGEISIKNLRTGTYSLIEKTTNKWYNLAEDSNIVIEWNKTTDVTVENELKKGQIKIIKVDADNNEIKLKGVKFEVLSEDGSVLEEIITDENGEAITNKYAVRDYESITLREKETLKEYSLNDEPQTIELKENEITTIQFTNEVKKGQIKVIKVDKDNNEVKLEGVKFEVYDENDKLIETLITDENGEAITSRLPISHEYTVKEVETSETYVLSQETKTVTLEEDEIRNLTFENEKKKGQIQVIKVDSENNEVCIPDVTFEIYNSKNELVDTITTDNEGKAITERLPIDEEYTIKETISNKAYVLNEETKTVVLEENEIKDIVFENTKKYGKIKINKLSGAYSKVLDLPADSPLANAKFLVINEKGEAMGLYTTDETGSILTEDLPYGEYEIYEYEAPENFFKNTTPQKVSITEDGQVIEVTFKNEPINPLPKTGF